MTGTPICKKMTPTVNQTDKMIMDISDRKQAEQSFWNSGIME
jgi:hypothetical protein